MIKIYEGNDFYNSHKKFNYDEKGFKLARDGNIFEDIYSSAKAILFVYEIDNEPVAFLKLYTNRKC